MEKYREAINNIIQEIKDKYRLEKNMLPLGYKILCHKEDRNCLTLSDNFYYFSRSMKELYQRIDADCDMMETYEGELCRYCANLKENIQKEICNSLLVAYGINQKIGGQNNDEIYNERKGT